MKNVPSQVVGTKHNFQNTHKCPLDFVFMLGHSTLLSVLFFHFCANTGERNPRRKGLKEVQQCFIFTAITFKRKYLNLIFFGSVLGKYKRIISWDGQSSLFWQKAWCTDWADDAPCVKFHSVWTVLFWQAVDQTHSGYWDPIPAEVQIFKVLWITAHAQVRPWHGALQWTRWPSLSTTFKGSGSLKKKKKKYEKAWLQILSS